MKKMNRENERRLKRFNVEATNANIKNILKRELNIIVEINDIMKCQNNKLISKEDYEIESNKIKYYS